MLILNNDDVCRALPMAEAVPTMKRAMIALCEGKARIPERIHLDTSRQPGTMLVMPGYVNDQQDESLAVKVVSVFNGNQKRGLPNILGVVNVFNPHTGQPIAVLDGAAVTAIRTAATSAAATDALANQDAGRLAIIGSGTQARTHFAAMCVVRNIRSACFYSPNRDKVQALIESLDADIPLTAATSSQQATERADIVCTTTNSKTCVIEDRAIKPGCHINAIGSYKPNIAEIPVETVLRSRIYVDQLQSAIQEAGDLVQPLQAGQLQLEQIIGELGQLLSGRIEGRRSEEDVTLFKSVGNTVQDVVASQLIVNQARKLGLGQSVEF